MASLGGRVTTLEQRMDMEAGLNASRDRDLSELTVTVRSHTSMLQAVQERQAEHSAILDKIIGILGDHSGRLGSLEGRLGSLEGRLGSLAGRLGSLEVVVGSLRQITTEGFAALGGQLQVIIDRDSDERG